MTRNELIEKCISINNEISNYVDKKADELNDFLIEREANFSKSKVRSLLKQLEKEGVNGDLLSRVKLFNEVR